jgi:Peptidase A4 family
VVVAGPCSLVGRQPVARRSAWRCSHGVCACRVLRDLRLGYLGRTNSFELHVVVVTAYDHRMCGRLQVVRVVLGVALLSCFYALPATARSWRQPRAAFSTAAGNTATPSFGGFAGYVWPGRVTSVSGSWTVPRVLRMSDQGWFYPTYTWIGAQAPGLTSASTPFIQVGTEEAVNACLPGFSGCPPIVYSAWWSDTARGFLAQPLPMSVRPGDRVTARLRLARGRWTVSISDARTSVQRRISTHQETHAHFNRAEWVQEDPLNERTDKQASFSTVSLSQLAVNTGAPLGADLLSLWMSENGRVLGPSPLRDDGFALVPQQPTAAGSQYQTLLNALDPAFNRFTREAQGWTPSTRAKIVANQRSMFVSALKTFIGSLTADRWPSGAQAAINALVVADRAELTQLQTTPRLSAAGIGEWIKAFERDLDAQTDPARSVRRDLGLPTY